MTGFLLLGVIAIWLAIIVFVARLVWRRMKPGVLRGLACALVVAVMIPLPVADELLSKGEFERLCAEGTKLRFDPEKIRGRTIFLAESPYPRPTLSVGMLTGYYTPSQYLDATTKETLISYNSYDIKGGFLIRSLGISETTAPLMMESFCSPPEKPWQKTFLNRYELSRIERKDVK